MEIPFHLRFRSELVFFGAQGDWIFMIIYYDNLCSFVTIGIGNNRTSFWKSSCVIGQGFGKYIHNSFMCDEDLLLFVVLI